MNSDRHSPGSREGLQPLFRITIRDAACLVLLLGIAIGAVAERVRTLPKESSRAGSYLYSVKPGEPLTEEKILRHYRLAMQTKPLHWRPLMFGANCLSLAAILFAFFVSRRLCRDRSPHLRASAARIAAALACLVFVTIFALVYVEAYHYFKQQLLAADWRYIFGGEWINRLANVGWRSVGVATIATGVIAAVEVATHLSIRSRIPANTAAPS